MFFLNGKPFTRLIQPVDIALTRLGKLEQELLLMAPMCDMPDIAWHKIAICSRHAPLQSDKVLRLRYMLVFTFENQSIRHFLRAIS